MTSSIFRLFFLISLTFSAWSCGRDQSDYNQQRYPQGTPYGQYGQYQNYGGQQAWVPYQQPPLNWVPGQSYYQQGVATIPPYYSYFNQPQNWQYNQAIGWNYQGR